MEKLSNTEAELKKSVAYKKKRVLILHEDVRAKFRIYGLKLRTYRIEGKSQKQVKLSHLFVYALLFKI